MADQAVPTLKERLERANWWKSTWRILRDTHKKQKAALQQEQLLLEGNSDDIRIGKVKAQIAELEIKIEQCGTWMENCLELIDEWEKDYQLRMLQDAEGSDLLEEAMESGYVLCHILTFLFLGIAGAGKTSFLHLVLNQPPPEDRVSTPLARKPEISRVMSQDGKYPIWKAASQEDIQEWLANAISAFQVESISQSQVLSPRSSKNLSESAAFQQCKSELQMPPPKKPKLSVEMLCQKEVIRELKEIMKKTAGPRKVIDDHWVYLVDTGGQPQFLDLLSTFIHHISGAALFVKLNESLSTQPAIEYYAKEGKHCGKPYVASLTHKETIENCLQLIQSRCNISAEEKECPSIFFVATHRDLEETCQESRESKNDQLLEMVRSREELREKLTYYRVANPEELLYAVNAKEPLERDLQVAGEFRKAVMSQCKILKKKIPLRWFILEQELQQLCREKGRSILSKEECKELARGLEMDTERLHAFFDHLVQLNMIKYFRTILPEVVFTTAQILLDKVSELIEYMHYLQDGTDLPEGVSEPANNYEDWRFRKYGIVTETFLRQLGSKHYVPDLFTPKELLKILTHELVFALKASGVYFMPCVLPVLPSQDLDKHRTNHTKDQVMPLLFYCPGNLFPYSCFNGLVAYLQNRSSWKIVEKCGEPNCLYKNCVKFKRFENPMTMTLIYSYSYMELYVQCSAKSTTSCPEIANTIFEGLQEATRIQRLDKHIRHDVAFFCSCEDNANSPHLATVSDPKSCCCSKDEEYNTDLTKQQLVWFRDTSRHQHRDDSALLEPDMHHLRLITFSSASGQEETLQLCQILAPKWETVGDILGLGPEQLQAIANPGAGKTVERCISEIFRHWLQNAPGLPYHRSFPRSWSGVYNLLMDCEYSEAAIKLSEARDAECSSLKPEKPSESGHMFGVGAFKEASFTVTKYGQSFQWKGYGISLRVPAHSLPSHVQQCTITITASLAGLYKFPEDSHLVSAVYWITCEPSCTLTNAMSVEIQHCSLRDNAPKLSIVRSYCNESDPSYTFTKVGGHFSKHSPCGYVEMDMCSSSGLGLAVTEEESEQREYFAHVYYIPHDSTSFHVHFVVTWNLGVLHKMTEELYSAKGARDGPYFPIEFGPNNVISLDLPMDGQISGGWKIVPLMEPVVTKKYADSVVPHKLIPCCQLSVKRVSQVDVEEMSPTFVVNLCGVMPHAPYNKFVIDCSPN